jgi:hypothetical protein
MEDKSQMFSATKAALRGKHLRVALLLLQVHRVYGLRVPNDIDYSLTWMASETRDSRLVKEVLALTTETTLNAPFLDACHAGNIGVLRMLIKEKLVSIHSPYNPLSKAVHSRKVEVVEELLTLGASPNGWNFCRNGDRPLAFAIRENEMNIVQALLRHRADPRFSLEAWDNEEKSYRAERSAIKTLLEEALERNDYYVDPVIPRVQLAVDAPDLCLRNNKLGKSSGTGSP